MNHLTLEQIDHLEDWITLTLSAGFRRTQFLEALRLARLQLEAERDKAELHHVRLKSQAPASCHKDTPINMTREELADKYADANLGYGPDLEKAYLAGYDAATEQMQAEIDALKQEVAGGSWAFVKQIEELQAKLAIAVEALGFVRNGGAPNGVVASVNERMLAMCEAATKALAKLGSESFGEKA